MTAKKYRTLTFTGSGVYIPEKTVLSTDLDDRLGKKHGWVAEKSGVLKRHFASLEESTSFMAAEAAKQALAQANLKPDALDCIVSACGVMEQPIPCTAALVQHRLGLECSGIPAFDINSTCLSFLSALDNLSFMVDAGQFKHVLIVSSDIPSLGLNWNDMESCTIFGDGAAAVIISSDTLHHSIKILASRMETYSSGISYCQVKAGGTRLHPTHFTGDLGQHALFEMDGKSTYKLAARVVDELVGKLLNDASLSLQDIDWVVPHQASKLSIYHLQKRLGIPEEKLINIYPEYGNQVAASLPSALHALLSRNVIAAGQRILLVGTSAGISIGGMLLEVNR